MSSFDLLRLLYLLCLASTVVIVFARGGKDERAGAAIVLLASVMSIAVQQPGLFDWHDNRLSLVLVDVGALVAFLVLALTSRRFWPLWTTAFHLIAVCTHLVIYLEPRRVIQSYALLQGFWAYPIMLTLILGAYARTPDERSGRRRLG